MQNPFDAKAALWDEDPRRVQMARAIAEAIAGAVPLKTTMQALEVGCGTGLVTTCLAPKLGSVIAVDTSAGMLDVLQAKIQALSISNIVPMRADLTGPHSIEGQFDLIFSSMTFHHIGDYNAILRMLHSLLKLGGWIAIADLDAEDGSFHDPQTHIEHRGFNRAEFKVALQTLGFTALGDCTAFVIPKNNRCYPVFLITGQKATILKHAFR